MAKLTLNQHLQRLSKRKQEEHKVLAQLLRDSLKIQMKYKAHEIKTIIGKEMLPKLKKQGMNWDKPPSR